MNFSRVASRTCRTLSSNFIGLISCVGGSVVQVSIAGESVQLHREFVSQLGSSVSPFDHRFNLIGVDNDSVVFYDGVFGLFDFQ